MQVFFLRKSGGVTPYLIHLPKKNVHSMMLTKYLKRKKRKYNPASPG
jgi:hypothetical protein